MTSVTNIKKAPAKAAAKKAPAKKATAPKAAPAVTTRTPEGATFTNNGQPIVRTRKYSLSFMAQEHGRGIDGPGVECSVDRFREVLAKLGVKDPLGTSWEVTLPNDHVVGFILPGETPRRIGGVATKRPSKNAPATLRGAAKNASTTAKANGTAKAGAAKRTAKRAAK